MPAKTAVLVNLRPRQSAYKTMLLSSCIGTLHAHLMIIIVISDRPRHPAGQ